MALAPLMDTEDCPFATMDELAMQLESWREEFQRSCGNETTKSEKVLVMTYGEDVILICKQTTGEFIKLTQTESLCPMSIEMS